MHRTQILLEEWQYEALRARAAGEGRSLSSLIREMITSALTPRAESARSGLDRIAGIGEDAAAYGESHDRYLYGDDTVD